MDQVIEAALAVGLDGMTMNQVAERLGVAKAVLYNYVESREELVRLAAAGAAQQHPFPEDRSQPWDEYAMEHARALFRLLTRDPQLLALFMNGGLGPGSQIDRAEMWLQAMTAREFTGEEAMRLLRDMGLHVVGAAAGFLHAGARREAGRPHAQEAAEAVRSRPADELPLLRRHLEAFGREADETSWEASLRLLFLGVETSRGKTGGF